MGHDRRTYMANQCTHLRSFTYPVQDVTASVLLRNRCTTVASYAPNSYIKMPCFGQRQNTTGFPDKSVISLSDTSSGMDGNWDQSCPHQSISQCTNNLDAIHCSVRISEHIDTWCDPFASFSAHPNTDLIAMHCFRRCSSV